MPLTIQTSYNSVYAGRVITTGHVFLESGQSNNQGVADVSDTPIPVGTSIGNVKTWRRGTGPASDMYAGAGQWLDLEYSTNQYEGRNQFGSILNFAIQLRDNLETANDLIYFIKADGNGKPISGWSPGENEYIGMVSGHITPALNSLSSSNAIDRVVLHDFFWDQGENDAGSDAGGPEYSTRLTALINNVRSLINAQGLRFVIRKLGDQWSGSDGVQVRQAQEEAVSNLANVEILRGPYSYNVDNVHLDGSAQNTIGSERYTLYAASPTGVEYNA